MYSLVLLSSALTLAGFAAACSPRVARSALRWTAAITLADGIIGFGFHIRGVARNPGGWRIPIVNIVMGPPIFAPLLFGTAAYLGLVASYFKAGGRASVPPVSSLRSPYPRGWRTKVH